MSITTHQSHEMVLRPKNFDQLVTFANLAAKSSMVPTSFRGKPEDIMLAIQMGSELGLAPMQALQNIAVINGRPSVWGDASIALVKVHPEFEDIQESIEGDGDDMVARCTVMRRGNTPTVSVFSVEHAKRAGLWGKSGPWQSYPKRMLQMRARGFALRDAFPDALKGLVLTEEAKDTPVDEYKGAVLHGSDPAKPDEFKGPTIEADPARDATPPGRDTTPIYQRVVAAVERVQNMAATPANVERAERLTRPLLAELDAADMPAEREALVKMLSDMRAAVDGVAA